MVDSSLDGLVDQSHALLHLTLQGVRVTPLPIETWTEYTPQIGVDPETLFAAAKRFGTALRSPSVNPDWSHAKLPRLSKWAPSILVAFPLASLWRSYWLSLIPG